MLLPNTLVSPNTTADRLSMPIVAGFIERYCRNPNVLVDRRGHVSAEDQIVGGSLKIDPGHRLRLNVLAAAEWKSDAAVGRLQRSHEPPAQLD